MWTSSYSKVFKSIKKEAIWQRWSDVNSWHEWIPNVESCRLDKPFASGNTFTLKPKGSPAVTVQLINVKKDQTFTGCTRFFGATMYDIHEMHQDPQGIRLTVTLKVTGPLAFIWRKLVAEKIEANLPTLLKNLAGAAGHPEFKKPTLPPVAPIHDKPKLHLITSVPQKPKSKSKKTKSKSKISTTALKKANPLLQSIPLESEISNRKVAKSMFTATKPKLSTPTPPKAKKKPKSRTSALKKAKTKKSTIAAKKPTVKKSTLAAKKPTAKKSTLASKKSKTKKSTSATKKPTAKKSTAASKKAKTKTRASAVKKSTAKPKAKSKAKPKAANSKPKAKSKAKPKAK